MQNSIPITQILDTPNLRLRSPSMNDIPHIFSASRYEGFTDGMLWEPPKTEAECIQPFKNSIAAWEDGGAYTFAIDDKKSSEFLGRIVIRKTSETDRWNTGFWTHPKHQGKGVMTEALGAILEFGFINLGAKKIEAAYAIWNKGSQKVLERNGLQFVKLIEEGFFKNGKWVAENLVEIDHESWASRNSDEN